MSQRISRRAVLRSAVAVAGAGALPALGTAAATPAAATPAAAVPAPADASHWRRGPGDWGDQGDGTYRNPVLNTDFSDPEVIRVGEDFYLVSSEFHFMGMTVLHSRDLVNWRYLSRVYDRLDISPYYDTPRPSSDPNTRYSKGSWAPALRHHDGRFWIYFCTPTEGLFMTTATDPAGPWAPLTAVHTYAAGEHPWEDPCPLWDDDGNAYLGHSLKGAGPIIMHRMSPDGTTLLDQGTLIYQGPNAEGTKLCKRNGFYYLIIPQNGFTVGDQWVLRSDNIWGPYASEAGKPVLQIGNGVTGPHQGALVDTPTGEWWFVHFETLNPIGRVMWLEPAAWTDDGWLRMGVDSVGDGVGQPVINYRKPDVGRVQPLESPASSDDFTTRRLGLQWEWNHNPVDDHWSLTARPGYLRLTPVGAVQDAYLANNTLTQKTLGRTGTVTTELDASGLVDGQRAGLLHISNSAQWIGVAQDDGVRRITTVIGSTQLDGPQLTTDTVQLRSDIDLDGETTFSYSLDGGRTYTQLGGAVTLAYANWKGSKPGLFTFNTDGTGGQADFAWFRYAHDGPDGGAPRTDQAPAYRTPGPITTTTNAGPNPYGLTSELTVAFTLTADRLTEAVPLSKLPATADGHSGGWAVALHTDGSLDWTVGGAADGTHTTLTVPHAYAAGVAVTVVCTLSVDTTGIPKAAVHLGGTRAGYNPHVPASTPVINTTTNLLLGAPFVTLTDIRIWKRALTAAEADAASRL